MQSEWYIELDDARNNNRVFGNFHASLLNSKIDVSNYISNKILAKTILFNGIPYILDTIHKQLYTK